MREQIKEYLEHEERLENAREIFNVQATQYLAVENDVGRLNRAINFLMDLTRGAKAINELERRGIGIK